MPIRGHAVLENQADNWMRGGGPERKDRETRKARPQKARAFRIGRYRAEAETSGRSTAVRLRDETRVTIHVIVRDEKREKKNLRLAAEDVRAF